MADVVISGASRGIGRALALALPRGPDRRLILLGRDRARLEELAGEIERGGGRAKAIAGDLGSLAGARAAGRELLAVAEAGATLVHNAGLWPARRELGPDGLEKGFVVNALAPLALQEPLLAAGRLSRVMVVSAGLIALGRFDPRRTPVGDDFSPWRTYCSTKLAGAVAMRQAAAAHREVDFAILHPGVVRTDLGARPGVFGWVLSKMKRGMEAPEVCGARLARILARPRWSPPGEARWLQEELEKPWPGPADDPAIAEAVLRTTRDLLGRAG